MTKQELVKIIIDNFTDKYGNLDLTDLDFSAVNGNINISNIKVKGDLWQDYQTVGGAILFQVIQTDLLEDVTYAPI